MRGDPAQQRVEVGAGAAAAVARGDQGARRSRGATPPCRGGGPGDPVALGQVVAQCRRARVGDVDLAVVPALAEHAQHVVAAAAVQVVAVQPDQLGDPQAEGEQGDERDGAGGVEAAQPGVAGVRQPARRAQQRTAAGRR